MSAGDAPLYAVLLAGGRSSRMGGPLPKPLLEVGGIPIARRVLAQAEPFVDAVAISTNHPRHFAGFAHPLVPDELPGFAGPLAGLLSAARWFAARHGAPFRLLSLPGDTPFLPADLVRRLASAEPSAAVVVASHAGCDHPTAALWHSGPLLATTLDPDGPRWSRSLRALQERNGCIRVDFPAGENGVDPFFNVNTPDDLTLAQDLTKRPG